MKKRALLYTLLLGAFLFISIGCDKKKDDTPEEPNGGEEVIDDLEISHTIPSSLGSFYINNFNRYTKITAPNGKPIHIVAQNLITDEQIIRCGNVLVHYLTNFPGSMYGANKSAVANKMADNDAILCLLNGEDGGNSVGNEVSGQPLYQNEIQGEGSVWYMTQDYDHRDATFEEILHFVHDYGIGVDGNEDGFIGALPDYQTKIRAAQENALTNNIWGMGSPNWIAELTEENSLSQEYLAAVIDAYYGLWGAWTDGNEPLSSTHSMWGLYTPKVRSEIASEDPMGLAVVKDFFQPFLTYNARIDASLNGEFSLKFDATKPYTNVSQYLKDVTLLGANNNSVVVNELDNNITGNTGVNTVIFSGNRSDYTIASLGGGVTIVTDNTNRDGVNRLKLIEKLKFTDQTVVI